MILKKQQSLTYVRKCWNLDTKMISYSLLFGKGKLINFFQIFGSVLNKDIQLFLYMWLGTYSNFFLKGHARTCYAQFYFSKITFFYSSNNNFTIIQLLRPDFYVSIWGLT